MLPEVIVAGLTWLLDKLIIPISEQVRDWFLQWKWQRFDWKQAQQKYNEGLVQRYGKLRIFGKADEVSLSDIFTDVYVLDAPTAYRRYHIDQLHEPAKLGFGWYDTPENRTNGLAIVKGKRNLYILGKPGAGKTTFLKHIVIQAVHGYLNRIPIFVSLHEWSNSSHGKILDGGILSFISQQLSIDNAQSFIVDLLKAGKVLVLFDGLDEVRQEDEQRRKLAQQIQEFTRKYSDCQYLITCRIAANEYQFSGFEYVEIADFSEEQILQYSQKWFGADHGTDKLGQRKYETFTMELKRSENARIRELCTSPLLLSMLCLYFDDTLAFPERRVELYAEALDALLRKWDAKRGIQRDQIFFGKISPQRKQQMFAQIAADRFENGNYTFDKKWLESSIAVYVARLPNAPLVEDIDGGTILNDLEAQHGIFVERAVNVYSFSHLTFQEYYTAKYIMENEAKGSIRELIRKHLIDDRWYEVFLLLASMLSNADQFIRELQYKVVNLTLSYKPLVKLLEWSVTKSHAGNYSASALAIRSLYLYAAIDRAPGLNREQRNPEENPVNSYTPGDARALEQVLQQDRPPSVARPSVTESTTTQARLRAATLDRACDQLLAIARIASGDSNYGPVIARARLDALELSVEDNLNFRLEEAQQLSNYLYANRLLVECLNLAYVSERLPIEESLLLPLQLKSSGEPGD